MKKIIFILITAITLSPMTHASRVGEGLFGGALGGALIGGLAGGGRGAGIGAGVGAGIGLMSGAIAEDRANRYYSDDYDDYDDYPGSIYYEEDYVD